MYIIVVGLNHKTAPVEIREKLSFTSEIYPQAITKLKAKKHIQGCAILSTCNRTELYAAVTDVDIGYNGMLDFLSASSNLPLSQFRDYLYTHTLYDAVRHLFRVASGLDSMVLGETEILGQVREAYQLSSESKGTNTILNTLFQQAITVGKRVRTETKIDQNPVSISYVAVELAKQSLGDLRHRSVLVIGAGKMSSLAVRYLVENGIKSLEVLNRSLEKAKVLAEEFSAKACSMEDKEVCLQKADIIISGTSAQHYVLTKEELAPVLEKRKQKSLLLIDIAVPRDIDPEIRELNGITLFDIDDLQQVVDESLHAREMAAVDAEKIIENEINSFFKWLSSLFVVPTIVALKEKAEAIKAKELERVFNRLAPLTEREKKVIGSLANSIVNQILHEPIINLKSYAATHEGHLYTQILQNLFNLEVEGEESKKFQTSVLKIHSDK